MTKTETLHLPEILRARREDIAGQAECEGCGTTLEECNRLAAENTDPTAPPWFGCCAMGTAMGPCSHRPRADLLSDLLKEIESGTIRTAGEVRAEREAKAAKTRDRREAATPPGAHRPLGWSGLFGQGEWWKTRDGRWIKVADMEESHRANTVRFLARRARGYADRVAFGLVLSVGDAPEDVVDAVLGEQEEMRRNPGKWIVGTALYRALAAGLPEPWGDELETVPAADHPFHGLGRTCSMPVEGVGDDFIRCGRLGDEHPMPSVGEVVGPDEVDDDGPELDGADGGYYGSDQ